MANKTIILGAGITGLTAGVVSRFPVYEATPIPGGICYSYYMRSDSSERLLNVPDDEEAYRFELGGGHWIWGTDSSALKFIEKFAEFKTYTRKASVYLPDKEILVPYPIQLNLRYLGSELAEKALREIIELSKVNTPVVTMAEWLEATFGPTLCELFFEPFHDLYTAGLYRTIAPQDPQKSPINLDLAIKGAFYEIPSLGYNTKFVYPTKGLNTLINNIKNYCDVHYGKKVIHIDINNKIIYFGDGTEVKYNMVISTLPLNKMIEICSLDIGCNPDPYTSVLVINIGATKGTNCPEDHWVYIPKSGSGFHRVGFYSNVDSSFLPKSYRKNQNKISIYVEKSYLGGEKPSTYEIDNLCKNVIKELQEWGWIKDVDVVDSTWIDVGYTWSMPGSNWRKKALKELEMYNIYQIGRFARWKLLYGILDSIKDGLIAESAICSLGIQQ